MTDPRKPPILCRLFGHRFPTGYRGDRPYLRIEFGTIDGVGVQHGYLTGECPRCRRKQTYAYLHIPTPDDPRWKRGWQDPRWAAAFKAEMDPAEIRHEVQP